MTLLYKKHTLVKIVIGVFLIWFTGCDRNNCDDVVARQAIVIDSLEKKIEQGNIKLKLALEESARHMQNLKIEVKN
jgi:hypothetical protein